MARLDERVSESIVTVKKESQRDRYTKNHFKQMYKVKLFQTRTVPKPNGSAIMKPYSSTTILVLGLLALLITPNSVTKAGELYAEDFNGTDLATVEWTGVFYPGGSDGGITANGYVWVYHNNASRNVIYTNEYALNTNFFNLQQFSFELSCHSYYGFTPDVSIVVEVEGQWYVSKTVFSETSNIFQLKTLPYNPAKENWDTFDLATVSRGAPASSDLSGDITGFGLYSISNLSCTAQYDNFKVIGEPVRSRDFGNDGIVNFQDFAVFTASWLTSSGEPNFNPYCDLDGNAIVDWADLGLFVNSWLSQVTSPYSAVQTNRAKINFNKDWKYYKGNAAAAFEHVMMDEVGTVQGQNNWYFGVSTSNTGPSSALMLYNSNLWGYTSGWVYPSLTSACVISDDRYSSSGRPPHQFTMMVECDYTSINGSYIPRIEWVSPEPNNSSIQISFNVMSKTGTQRFRILRNGLLVWESPALAVYTPTDFVVNLSVNKGDILTFMQSTFVLNAVAIWNYLTITENAGNLDGASAVSFNDSFWNSVRLPYEPLNNRAYASWPALTYKGIGWYRKHFSLDSSYQGKKLFLEFKSANVTGDVWINGVHLTTHYGGFLPFMVDISDKVYYDGTDNVIAVKVNSFNQPDVPSLPEFGGINSDVLLHVTDKLHITDAVDANEVAGGGIFVTYPSVSDTIAQVQIKTNIVNENATSKNCRIETYIVDSKNMIVAQIGSTKSISAGSDCTCVQSTSIANPQLWHPDHPNLYTVYTRVYDGNIPVDDCRTRIGIRAINFSKAEGFKINGKPLKFRGANSNRGYPYVGWAVGNQAIYRNVAMLKEEGFNYLRPSPEARPDDPNYLDACDELGLLVLDSIHLNVWQDTTLFKNRCYQAMRDLIRRDRNHPCVIAWELSLTEQWWTDPQFSPNCMSIGHAEYPGDQCYVAAWKDGGSATTPGIFDIFIATPSAGARTYAGPLPLIISEHGHWEYVNAGSGMTSDVRRGDGEVPMLNQAHNHQESHNLNRALTNMCGDGVFCGTDYLAYPSGTTDIFKLPKFSYYFWQSQRDPNLIIPNIDSGPMVYIANYWTASSPRDVKVYSNCEQVKLYINDALISTRVPDSDAISTNLAHPPFTFTGVTWQSGTLKAVGYINGQVAATCVRKTPGSPLALSVGVNPIYGQQVAEGDIVFVYVSVLDSNSTVVPSASNAVTLAISSGPATLVGFGFINAEAGIATFVIRILSGHGPVIVTATSTGLTGGSAALTIP